MDTGALDDFEADEAIPSTDPDAELLELCADLVQANAIYRQKREAHALAADAVDDAEKDLESAKQALLEHLCGDEAATDEDPAAAAEVDEDPYDDFVSSALEQDPTSAEDDPAD